jgi:hypothetical protein
MITSTINNLNQRIIPTSEELKILREKISNIKDLYIFKNPSSSTASLGQKKSFIDRDNSSTNNLLEKSQREDLRNFNLHMNKSSSNFNLNPNLALPEKEVELLNQRYFEIQKFLEINKDKIEKIENYDELMKENEELKNEISKYQILDQNLTFKEILNDYMRMKSEFLLLTEINSEQEKHILNLEKQIKMLMDIDSNSVNKNYLRLFIVSLISENNSLIQNKEIQKMLSEIFNNSGINTVQLLSNRIETLELQNFSLITKLEKMSQVMKDNLNELIEYSEVISDIKNVLNQVYESQSLTTEFLIIRDTLNNRSNFLTSQKENFLQEKERLANEGYKQLNIDILLCKDKITESKVKISSSSNPNNFNNYNIPTPVPGSSKLNISNISQNVQNNRLLEILDEKIEIYENLKNNLAQYEDYINYNKTRENNNIQNTEMNLACNMTENLLNENYILKTKNIKLRELVTKIIKSKSFDIDMIDEEIVSDLNEILNSKKDVAYSEDLFYMMKSQALLLENLISSN